MGDGGSGSDRGEIFEQLKEEGRESACEVTEIGRACAGRPQKNGVGMGNGTGQVGRSILMNWCAVGGSCTCAAPPSPHCWRRPALQDGVCAA